MKDNGAIRIPRLKAGVFHEDKDIKRIYERAFFGSIGFIFAEHVYNYLTDPKQIRKRNHRSAMKDLEDMGF